RSTRAAAYLLFGPACQPGTIARSRSSITARFDPRGSFVGGNGRPVHGILQGRPENKMALTSAGPQRACVQSSVSVRSVRARCCRKRGYHQRLRLIPATEVTAPATPTGLLVAFWNGVGGL